MRTQFCDALVARSTREKLLFLTGDLGFMALEPLQRAMRARFINAGVAEQNMVSVAAGLAGQGFEAWAYSIAPFCYARPFEQIRNDVCFHKLPVKLVGNGGGYGYGVMGPTHHAIEDYGVLLCLPNLSVFVPAFDEDVPAIVQRAGDAPHATYLRLGRGEKPPGHVIPDYAPWRQLTEGAGSVVVAVGPLAGTCIASFESMPSERRPNLWVLSELPVAENPPPPTLLTQLAQAPGLVVVEEHVRRGGVGPELLAWLTERRYPLRAYAHAHAQAHHYARYGSQTYLRAQSGLDPTSIVAMAQAQPASGT